MKKVHLLAALLSATFAVSAANAQMTNGGQTAMAHHDNHQMADSPATAEFEQAMEEMHGPMMEGIMAQDPDVAFVKGMIPHHEGAIAMAQTILKYGKDPEIRHLAENVVRDQQKEVQWMQEWLSKHEK